MPESTPARKKYRRTPVYGNRKIPAKPNWMKVTRMIGFTLLALLMVATMVGLILKHFPHA